jgi:phosphatidylserine/phosphatidylglycerophosphate/cardiolipin synthase-like enzyme
VLINEFLPAPRALFREEWIELYNRGNSTVEFGNWSLDDIPDGGSRPYRIPAGTSIAPGGFLLFNGSTTRLSLGNDGDSVRLLDAAGNVVDSRSFGAAGYDVSFGRFPDGGAQWRTFNSPTPGASNGEPPPPELSGRALLMTQVYYCTYDGRHDEFVAVSNPSRDGPAGLDGWAITDGRSSVRFPRNATIAPGATVFVTGNASEFGPDEGFLPDFETRGSRADVRQAAATGNWPCLSNDGGFVALEDADGAVVDAFAWGKGCNLTGWTGPPAEALPAGEAARRANGLPGGWLDTNSSADWPPARAQVVGRSDFPPAAFEAEELTAFVSPDCSYPVLARELDAARSAVYLEVYQFESWPLARILTGACQRGVDVRVLLEGSPVDGIPDQERAVAALLASSGAAVAFAGGNQSVPPADRYAFVHSKFCVIDNTTSIVTSENWKSSGFPPERTRGNRGWGAAVRSAGLAAYLAAVFMQDSNPLMRDVIPYCSSAPWPGPPPAGFVPETGDRTGTGTPLFEPADFGPGVRVLPVLSPDTSGLADGSVVGLLGSAAESVCVELLSCSLSWTSARENAPVSYIDALLSAARRGVKVRVLLDGTYTEPDDFRTDNGDVLNYLAYTAARERLDLQARIARIPGTLSLHNKGVVIDGKKALVSSINWDPTSVLENREAGLILEDPGVAAYFERVFQYDWNASAAPPRPNGTAAAGHPGAAPDLAFWALRAGAVLLPASLVAAAVALLLRRSRSARVDYSPPGRRIL